MIFIYIFVLSVLFLVFHEYIFCEISAKTNNSCVLLNKRKSIFNEEFLTLIVLVLLALISCTRYETGGSDYFAYKKVFNNIPNLKEFFININKLNEVYDTSNQEIGWLFINSFFKTCGFAYNGLIFFHSLFFFLCFYIFLKKFSCNKLIIIPIFLYKLYFYNTMVSMRQSTTIAIFFLIANLIYEKKFIKYFIVVFIACLIHKGAVFLFFAYFVGRIKLSKKLYLCLTLSGLIVFLLVFFNFINFTSLLENLISFSNNTFKINYSINLNYLHTRPLNIFHTLEYLLILFVIYIFYNDIIKTDKYASFVIKMLLCLIPIFLFFRDYDIITRMKDYFTIFYAFIVIYLLKIKNGRYKKIVVFITITISYYGMVRYINNFDNGHFYNYKTILFDKLYLLFGE